MQKENQKRVLTEFGGKNVLYDQKERSFLVKLGRYVLSTWLATANIFMIHDSFWPQKWSPLVYNI